MSKEGLEKAKEIAKLMRKIKGYKYEYYTPDTPMQKMIKEERIRLNCHDNQKKDKKKGLKIKKKREKNKEFFTLLTLHLR